MTTQLNQIAAQQHIADRLRAAERERTGRAARVGLARRALRLRDGRRHAGRGVDIGTGPLPHSSRHVRGVG